MRFQQLGILELTVSSYKISDQISLYPGFVFG